MSNTKLTAVAVFALAAIQVMAIACSNENPNCEPGFARLVSRVGG